MVDELHASAAAAMLPSWCHAVCVQLKELKMPSEEQKAGKKEKKKKKKQERRRGRRSNHYDWSSCIKMPSMLAACTGRNHAAGVVL